VSRPTALSLSVDPSQFAPFCPFQSTPLRRTRPLFAKGKVVRTRGGPRTPTPTRYQPPFRTLPQALDAHCPIGPPS
jgi:hypothetical protein